MFSCHYNFILQSEFTSFPQCVRTDVCKASTDHSNLKNFDIADQDCMRLSVVYNPDKLYQNFDANRHFHKQNNIKHILLIYLLFIHFIIYLYLFSKISAG